MILCLLFLSCSDSPPLSARAKFLMSLGDASPSPSPRPRAPNRGTADSPINILIRGDMHKRDIANLLLNEKEQRDGLDNQAFIGINALAQLFYAERLKALAFLSLQQCYRAQERIRQEIVDSRDAFFSQVEELFLEGRKARESSQKRKAMQESTRTLINKYSIQKIAAQEVDETLEIFTEQFLNLVKCYRESDVQVIFKETDASGETKYFDRAKQLEELIAKLRVRRMEKTLRTIIVSEDEEDKKLVEKILALSGALAENCEL